MALPADLARARVLFGHEFRRLVSGLAYWVMLVSMALLTGYGYIQAVRLFGEASRTALQFPELARGMAPLDGILVPTLGAFYLGTTLLFPFVAIRTLGQDKESGALKLALQWPLSPATLVAVKMLALGAAWLSMLLIPLSALAWWRMAGGHLAFAETGVLVLGHAFYALAVAGIAFFAVAVTESAATAAIVALAFTLGFWVLDFAAGTGPEWLKKLGEVSPTQALKQFEHGVFSLPHALGLTTLGVGLAALAIPLLSPSLSWRRKATRSAAVALVLIGILAAAPFANVVSDVSDDRRNSFNPADESALARMDRGLSITLFLSPEDSRAHEISTNVLGKLQRLVPGLKVRWADVESPGPFGAPQSERYGLIVYEYGGRRAESRSNSAREILPLLHELAGTSVTPESVAPYPGYPLVADPAPAAVWFYGAVPALLLFARWRVSRAAGLPSHLRELEGVKP